MKSRFIDWSEAVQGTEWQFIGADLMRERALKLLETCQHGNKEKGYCDECECYPDDVEDENRPMFNYAYLIETFGGDLADGKIIEICEQTALTVVHNTHEDKYYLSLCGAGMDFSQSIAHAYMIAYAMGDEELGIIDWDFIDDVYLDGPLSVGEKTYQGIMKQLASQYKTRIRNMQKKLERIQY